MENQQSNYEVACKHRASFSKNPPAHAPLFKKWKDRKVYDNRTKAEESVDHIHRDQPLRREIKKDLTTLLIFEFMPSWGAHEQGKWQAYHGGGISRHYVYFRIKPVR